MAFGFLTASPITAAQIAAGMKMSEIPGDRGIVQSALCIVSVSGLTEGTFSIAEILAPANPINFESGPVDATGSRSVSVFWLRDTGDTLFGQAGGGPGTFPNGFWDVTIRGLISPNDQGYGEFLVGFSSDNVVNYNEDLIDSPHSPSNDTPNWNGDQGQVTLHIQYDNANNEDPDSIAIIRNGEAILNIPWVDGTTDYSITDTVFAADTYEYDFLVYKYPGSKSGLAGALSVPIGGIPSIEMIMSGGMSFGGSMGFNFLVDPSGIYKLTTGLKHDELYNRADPLDIVVVDVAIPTPFIDTYFMGK
jgi:hypothetical protein